MQSFPPASEDNSLHCPTILDKHKIAMIEEALAAVGDFGEVRLVIERGRLRFVVTHRSYDVLKWSPGTIHDNGR